MREAGMKCRVVSLPFLCGTSQSASQAPLAPPTRRRKLAADANFCCQFRLYHYVFSAQIKRVKVKMNGKTRTRKALSAKYASLLHLVTASRILGQNYDIKRSYLHSCTVSIQFIVLMLLDHQQCLPGHLRRMVV